MCTSKDKTSKCTKEKEKQVPSRPGYRLFMDITSFKHESISGKRHWLIVVDEFSDCSHSFFWKRKSDQIELFPIWIKELKQRKIPTLMGRSRAMLLTGGDIYSNQTGQYHGKERENQATLHTVLQ